MSKLFKNWKTLCSTGLQILGVGVQNGGSPLRGSGKREKLDKLKVKAVKQNNNMLNGTLKSPNECPKCKEREWWMVTGE